MTDQTVTPEEETNTLKRLWMIGVNGLYEVSIDAVSSAGYLVDAANHLPVVLNALPGEQGFTPFTDKPFLGSGHIHASLTGGLDAYYGVTNITVPEPVTLTEHFAEGTGKAIGLAATALAAGPIIGAANSALVGGEAVVATTAATEVSAITRAVTAVTENAVVATGLDAAKYLGTKALGLTGSFAIANPLLTTALATGAGIGSLTDIFNNPAKTAGMLGVVFGVNALLNDYVGNLFGLIAGIAIALYFNQTIGSTANAVVDKGKELLEGVSSSTRRDPAMPGPGLP